MAAGVKTGGRQLGTPNRLTNELRAVLKDVLAKEYSNLTVLLGKLEPKDRLEMIVELPQYTMPKIEPVYFKEDEPLTW